MRTAVASLLALSTTSPALAEEFPAVAFLQRPTPENAPAFVWPAQGDFQRVWSGAERKLVRIALVDLAGPGYDDKHTELAGVLVSVWPKGDRDVVGLRLEHAAGDDFYLAGRMIQPGEWRVVSGSIDRGPLMVRSGERTLVLRLRYVSPITEVATAAWTDWTYTTTLLTREAPVYERHGDDPWRTPADWPALEARWKKLQKDLEAGVDVRAELAALLETKTPPSSHYWELALRWARTHDPDLALRIYRRYLPIGQCSMDTRPQEVAREYAELCYERGRLGCFLELQVQIMGNQFARVASSSYGEQAHRTEAERLLSTGVDVERFFRGLTIRFATSADTGRELQPWRIGKAGSESAPERLEPMFTALVQDTRLDEYNRFRAGGVLFGMSLRGEGATMEAALAKMAALDVPRSVREMITIELADIAKRRSR